MDTITSIREARRGLHLTQAALAEKMGAHVKTVHRYEHGLLAVPMMYRLALAALVAGVLPVGDAPTADETQSPPPAGADDGRKG